jgi:hypothetical protein
MAHNYRYNILPIADCEDKSHWQSHCSAVRNLITYSVKGLLDEYSKDKHVDFDINTKTLTEVLGWVKQLGLVEILEDE